MKTVIAMILSAAAVVAGAVLHYVATSGAGSRGLANAGTEFMVAGVIGLALGNVIFLMTRNRRRPAPRAVTPRAGNGAATRNIVTEGAGRLPVHSPGR